MIYKYNYTEQSFGCVSTKQEAHDIAEAIQWEVQKKFEEVEFIPNYDPNFGGVHLFESSADEETAEEIKRFLDQNWADIAGKVLEGTFWNS